MNSWLGIRALYNPDVNKDLFDVNVAVNSIANLNASLWNLYQGSYYTSMNNAFVMHQVCGSCS